MGEHIADHGLTLALRGAIVGDPLSQATEYYRRMPKRGVLCPTDNHHDVSSVGLQVIVLTNVLEFPRHPMVNRPKDAEKTRRGPAVGCREAHWPAPIVWSTCHVSPKGF